MQMLGWITLVVTVAGGLSGVLVNHNERIARIEVSYIDKDRGDDYAERLADLRIKQAENEAKIEALNKRLDRERPRPTFGVQ